MEAKLLEQIGLTKGEISVYFAMLELGASTVGPIIDKSRVSSSKIYDILGRLIDKGLVSYVVRENRKYFEAASPKRILDYLKEKEDSLKLQEAEIEKLMPQLLLKQKMAEKSQEVTIYEGVKGVKTVREKTLQNLKKGEEFCILGVSGDSTNRLSDYWENYHERRGKAGIKVRMLCDTTAPKDEVEKRNNYKFSQAKYMPIDISTPTWIEISQNVATIGIPSENPIAIEIKNKDVAQSFKSYFEALWNQKVSVYEGNKKVTKLFSNILTDLKAGEEYFVINANHMNIPELGKYFKGFHIERQKRGIKANLLVNQIIAHNVKNILLPPVEYKFLPKDFKSPLQVTFYKNKLLLTLWGKKSLGFLIERKELADAFKAYFDTLWNQETRVIKGLDAIESLFEEVLECGKLDYIGARGYFMDLRPEYINKWEKRAIALGFKMRNIVDKSVKGHKITKFPFVQTKYTLPDGFSNLSVFWIYGNKVVIANWTEKEPIAVIIENQHLHDMYQQQFELLWNKEIK